MDILEIMKKRRSIRFYSQEQIKKEELDKILEAGLWAPNAGSRQAVKFVVVQDKELNEKLGKINRKIFGKARIANDQSGSIASDDSIQNAFYNAPTVVYLFAPNNYPNSIQDCCVASQNMMLEACALDIGSIYIARGEKTFESELGKECMAKWGLTDEYQCHSIIPLGYALKEGQPHSRKEDRVIFD